MRTLDDLRRCAAKGLDYLKSQKDVKEAEIFVSCNDVLTVRLNYTSDIPCNGVHEPKNILGWGVGIVGVFGTQKGVTVGFGSESSDLSLNAIKRALGKARRGAVKDPNFKSLPAVPSETPPSLISYHDERVMKLDDEEMVALGWQALSGTLTTFKESGYTKSLILNGDVTVLKERMAVANTSGIYDYDESTIVMAAITTMIEEKQAKGTGWATATYLNRFDPKKAGLMAAKSAIGTVGGRRIESGNYKVVFGRQPVTEILSELLVPSLTLSRVDAGGSPFTGKLGEKIASDIVSVYDDGAVPGEIGSKKITCEGLPTGRTDLIDKGKLVGLLANHYYAKKCENLREFPPRNGFRFGGGGRSFQRPTGIFATNIVVEGSEEVTSEELISQVKDGIYIGRIWYVYPINALARADFTGTIAGDSYIIRDGKLTEPLKPNTVRIRDNFVRVLVNIRGVSKEKKSTLVWGSKEVVIAPEIFVDEVSLENIAQFMETL